MIDEKEMLSMKIIHYFIINENYAPIVIKGIDDEVWLENKNNAYSIIRIVTKHIHNKEQYDYDVLKTKHIAKQIKRRTLDFSMNVLSIYIDNAYDIENQNLNSKYISITVNDDNEFKNNSFVSKSYKNIDKNFNYDNETIENFDLMNKITFDIGNKNLKESEKREKIMKSKLPIVTYVLLIINILVFIFMYILGNGSESSETLINFGANYLPLTKSGDYYRLITSAFLHIGIIHLLLNMYSLYIIGTQIEYFYGKVKYIIIYLFSALMGSLFTVALSSSNTLAAGASGAIFGLLGALLYFGYHYRGYIGNAIIRQVIPIVILNLYIGFVTPGIGNYAHIGGLVGGYIIAMGLGFDKEDKVSRINGIVISILLTIFMIYMGFIR